uniref:Uncharacterized protein n=1 Tax=Anopheles merus TaxID=30066 RepID=A0A182V7D3_ANOME
MRCSYGDAWWLCGRERDRALGGDDKRTVQAGKGGPGQGSGMPLKRDQLPPVGRNPQKPFDRMLPAIVPVCSEKSSPVASLPASIGWCERVLPAEPQQSTSINPDCRAATAWIAASRSCI